VIFLKSGEPRGRSYTYLSQIDLVVGDKVDVETKYGITHAIVTEIDVPVEEVESFKSKLKEVVGKTIPNEEEEK
jgi:hypothetical protein